MFNKKYKFFKFMLFIVFIFSCIIFIYNLFTTIHNIYNGKYSNIINDTHKIFILGVFIITFILSFKLIFDIEKNNFLLNSKKNYCIISNVFLIGAIIEFIYTNFSMDESGFGIIGTDISVFFIFFIYNYIIYRIIPYLIKVSIDLYNNNNKFTV